MLYRSGKSKTNWELMNFLLKRKKVNPQWISLWLKIQELQDKVNSPSDAARILWSWNSEKLWVTPRSQSACEYSESKRFDQPRFLLAACYTELIVVHQETFLKVYLHQVNEPTASRSWNVRARSLTATAWRTCVSKHRKICSESSWNKWWHSKPCNSYTKMCKGCFN